MAAPVLLPIPAFTENLYEVSMLHYGVVLELKKRGWFQKLDVFFFLNMYNRKSIFMISSVSWGNGSQGSFFVCRGSVRKRQSEKTRGRRLKPAQWNRAYGDS